MPRTLSLALLFILLASSFGVAPIQEVQSLGTSPDPNLVASGSCAAPISGVQDRLDQVDSTQWQTWIKQLSGFDGQTVTVGSQQFIIQTRHSEWLFDETLGVNRSRAFDFVRQQVLEWYPAGQIEEDAYQPYGSSGPTWKNLVLTIPGTRSPWDKIILSAHLDSRGDRFTFGDNTIAPGADDNGTGSATLLEAARVLKDHPQPRTVRLIWFTGEEQGLLGSQAYIADHSLAGVIADVNADMFGYDGDNDRCVELHVGILPASNVVGQCFVDSIQAYNINLTYGYLTDGATTGSDHSSFWNHNIGAVEVLENYPQYAGPVGCPGTDWSPYYHNTTDTFDHLSLSYSFDVARAVLAATFSLANLQNNEYYLPMVKN
jgi:hypothetical protein